MKIIKDKIAKLSFVALLIVMTAAIFYTPTGHDGVCKTDMKQLCVIFWVIFI